MRLFVSVGFLLALVAVACALWLRASQAHSGSLSQIAGPLTKEPKGKWVKTLASQVSTATTAQEAACDYYASPTGTGNGLSSSSPFRISSFWPVAAAGKTLCLLDGTYTGDGNMLLPPRGLNGASGAPITIRALNDGRVLITGQSSRRPVRLVYNDWFVIEGINACCSTDTVVELEHSNHNVVRRVAAWDAADSNTNAFAAHYGDFNLFEDVAGWGTARKIFTFSQGGDYTTVRRAWGRWERSTVVGGKVTYSLAYNAYHVTCENCLGTWSGQGMPQSYVLMDYYGKPWTGTGAGTYTNYAVEQPRAIFNADFEEGDKNAHIRLLGSLAYIQSTDNYKPPYAVFITKLDSVEIRDTAVYIAPGTHTSVQPFGLYGLPEGTPQHLIAENLTAFGGSASFFQQGWLIGNVWAGSSPATGYAPGENILNTARGANLYYRYQDGILTDQPLWPWPMNQRIKEALVQSGRDPVDITATIVQTLFRLLPRPPVAPMESPRPSPSELEPRPEK